MKKILLLVLLPSIIATTAYSQILYFGGGGNFSFVNNGSLDFVIGRYNDTRSFLDIRMKDFNYLRGAIINVGGVTENGFTFEMSWTGRHWKRFAEGVDVTNTLVHRDVKLRNNSLSLGMGYTRVKESVFCPGLLALFDFGSFKAFTRVGPADQVGDTDYDRVMKGLQLGMTFMLNLMIAGKDKPIGFAIRPYYQVHLFALDFQKLNEAINSNTAADDLGEDLTKGLHNFGIQAVFLFTIRED